jgi:hypothetical protein
MAVQLRNSPRLHFGKGDKMISNNCIHFKCDFENEWCELYKDFKCQDCKGFEKTEDENIAWEGGGMDDMKTAKVSVIPDCDFCKR